MADDENTSSRKRVADREINKCDQNPDKDSTDDEPEMGSFQRASDEVMATRRIIQVLTNQPESDSNTPSNPFSGVKLLPTSDATAGLSEEQEEVGGKGKVAPTEEDRKEAEKPGVNVE